MIGTAIQNGSCHQNCIQWKMSSGVVNERYRSELAHGADRFGRVNSPEPISVKRIFSTLRRRKISSAMRCRHDWERSRQSRRA